MRKRIFLMAIIIIFVFFSILIIRLINLQIINARYLFKMANSQQLASTKLTAKRGIIYDRNMVPLAQSATAWDAVLEPNYIKNDETREIISQGLSEILDIPKEEILEASKKKSSYKIIKKKIDSNLKDKIIDFKAKNNITSGIRLIENYKRYYPMGNLASNILGFTGDDGQGLLGLESKYEKVLKGEDGKLVSAKNAIGTDMPYDYEHMIPPKDGDSLVLTIDSNIQKIAERCLKQAVTKNDARNGGFAIAMDPQTGEILALAVYPSFDPNNPFELCDEDKKILENTPNEEKTKKKSELLSAIWDNTVVNSLYYPGSVFKMIVAAMGLELGLVNENSNFNCSGGIKISDRIIRCHKRSGHGPLNFEEALCKSCNSAFISLGQKIGAEKFFDFYNAFGFHEKTGIDLPGETKDVFFENMQPIDLAVASIGQNFGIPPISMATAACAIANGGNLVTPHIVKEIKDKDGKTIKSFSTKIRRSVISSETAKRVSDMMAQNTISGGAKNAYVPGFRIAGKTGTSEKKEKLLVPGQKDYMSSYCGFAPVEDPKILILIGIDTPKGGQYYGSVVAAPSGGLFFSEVLLYMGIKPQYNEEESKKYGIEVPNLIGKKTSEAKINIINLGLQPVIIGKGEEVLSQVPSAGSLIAQNGTVVIYTENNSENDSENNKVKVPNFIGMKKSDAIKIAESAGLNISVSGSSNEEDRIKTQSPSGSEYVPKGTTVNVVVHNDNLRD
ncbi:MAG: PASTA domain-containing protein [Clostridia bacterium]|nr:PASTA domain-containing protein [Clostridia bacterium]